MWEMFTNALRLFLKGKLFRDPWHALRQWAIGVGATLLVLTVLLLLGAPLWLGVSVAALGGGALQPWLFRDLKYA